MIHMTLYWGKEVTLLVDTWRNNSWPTYLLSLLVCFSVSVFYNFLTDLRLRFRVAAAPQSPASAPLLGSNRRVASAALFGLSSALGYLLMLAVMSFNGGVLVTAVVGMVIGYFVFMSGDEWDEIVADDLVA